MRDRHAPIRYLLGLFAATLSLWLVGTSVAHADVVGRLHFSVKNADDEKPLANAKIVLKDSAGVRPDVTLTTDAQGSATSPPLDTRAWQITTDAEKPDTFQTDTRSVTVVADTTTEVEVLMEPVKEKTIKITANKNLLNKNATSNSTHRNQTFLQTFPVTGSNPLSTQRILLTNPGFVEDSVQQAHPRGEHSSTTIFIDGFELPDVLIGRAGAFLPPSAIQDADIMTGGYAPEYGGETAAILNLTLRAGTIKPFQSVEAEGGEFSTFDGSLAIGGQSGRAIGKPDANGNVARAFGYFLDLSARTTDNALEPPQPDDQTAHNHGESQAYFGNFDFNAGSKDEFTFTLNSAPAYTQVANRTGLPAFYASVGQELGFGGALTAEQAAAEGIGSQEQDGQDIYQRDVNDFGVLKWRHNLSQQVTSLLSVALLHSGQSILNNNPAINLGNLPADNSIEFNPTIVRNYHHAQTQGSLTYAGNKHTIKGGFLYDYEEGDESYQLIPGSQLALNDLAALDPALAPAGTIQMMGGQPVLDKNGNPVYLLNPGATSPTLPVHRNGFYGAAYIQDTWTATRHFTANYGLRLDWYKQTQDLGQAPVDTGNLSPRVNLTYSFNPRTVLRASYNHLFIQPPLAQGAIIGEAIQPETYNQYDVSIERQLSSTQTVKLAYYAKNMHNQIDTGLLIPNTQIGVYTSVTFTEGNVHGVELSWDLVPKNNVGLAAYLSYTNSLAKPGGVDNTGGPAPIYNDHDQLNTISTGLSYTWKSGANVGADFYYGSGLASSVVFPTDALGNGQRSAHSRFNLQLSTGPGLFGGGSKDGHGGLTLNITNLFDDRSVINFNSGFSGTRFDQGRTILLSVFGKF
jgi:outer membrane receptor protein involved in Fe transport